MDTNPTQNEPQVTPEPTNPSPTPASPTPAPTPTPIPTPVTTAPTPTPTPEISPSPNSKLKGILKRPIVLAVAGVILAAIMYLYFFFLPNMLASNYLNNTKKPHETYKASIDKTIGSFGRPAFTSATTEPKTDQKDLDYASAAVKESEAAAVVFDKQVSSLVVLPGTGWSSKVKQSVSQKGDYNEYRKTSGQFLTSYKALIEYFNKLNALELGQEEVGEKLGKEIETATSPMALGASFNKMAVEIEKLSSDLRKIEPPDYLRDTHNQYLKLVDQTVTLLKAMGKDLTSGNFNISEAQYEEFLKFAEEADAQVAKFVDKLQNHSILREQINRLKGTNNLKAV